MNTMEPIRDIETVYDIADYLRARSERNYVMFMFGIYTGLRISDILKFKVRDVKNKDFIYLREQKKKRERKIVINDELKEILKEFIKDKEEFEYLFKSRKGLNKPIVRETAYAILKDAAQAFGLECIGCHTLRKTYGYFVYLLSDKNVAITKEALGQKDIYSTLSYIGVNQDIVNKTVGKLSFKKNKRN